MSLFFLLNQQPPYQRTLLSTAERLLTDNEPAIALVTAHMACEIYAEQVMSVAFKKRGLDILEDAVTELLPSNNLANERVRNLYVALTGDRIQETAFWAKFKESARLRNCAVHHGERISPEQGRASCEVAAELLAHLDGVLRTFPDPAPGS